MHLLIKKSVQWITAALIFSLYNLFFSYRI